VDPVGGEYGSNGEARGEEDHEYGCVACPAEVEAGGHGCRALEADCGSHVSVGGRVTRGVGSRGGGSSFNLWFFIMELLLQGLPVGRSSLGM
jgi:hypothetical protein